MSGQGHDKSGDAIGLDRTALLVLAAGASSRMGCPKALIELDDRPILEHILTLPLLNELGDVVVVLGHDAEAIGAVVDRSRRRSVVNAEPDRGRMSSIQTGLRALGSGIEGVFLQPVDCPLVGAEVFRALAVGIGSADVAVPGHEGRTGHPPLFRSMLFDRILDLGPDEPLRDVFQQSDIDRRTIEVNDPAVLLNLDRPGDLVDLYERYLAD